MSKADGLRFPEIKLDTELVSNLRRFNPWWEGLPGVQLPPHRRAMVDAIHKCLRQRLAPIVITSAYRWIWVSAVSDDVL